MSSLLPSPANSILPVAIMVATTGCLSALVMGATAGLESALGVALGSGIALGNLLALSMIVRAVFSVGGGRAVWGILGGMKTAGLYLFVLALLSARLIDGFPLVVGILSLPLGAALAAVLFHSSNSPNPPVATATSVAQE